VVVKKEEFQDRLLFRVMLMIKTTEVKVFLQPEFLPGVLGFTGQIPF
jgi:hypothetical protein